MDMFIPSRLLLSPVEGKPLLMHFDAADMSSDAGLTLLRAVERRMGRAMVRFYCQSFARVPGQIVLDIDDTFDAVHGHQQLRLFNAYYDDYG